MNTARQQAARLISAAAAAGITFAIFSSVVANAAPEQGELMARAQQAGQATQVARAEGARRSRHAVLVALANAR